MSSETWHEERNRLVLLLHAIEKGDITHIDEDGLTELQATTPDNVRFLTQRLAKLNGRLG